MWDFVSHYQKYCSGWISPFKAAALSVSRVVRCSENRVVPAILVCTPQHTLGEGDILVQPAAPCDFLSAPTQNGAQFLGLPKVRVPVSGGHGRVAGRGGTKPALQQRPVARGAAQMASLLCLRAVPSGSRASSATSGPDMADGASPFGSA